MTTPSPAAPTAPLEHDTVRAEVEIAAAPDDVFRALTDPEELAAWWGSDETYRTHDWTTDVRPGGAWSVRTTDRDGNEGTVHGQYTDVVAPRSLEFTWKASWDDGAPTRVRYELTPAAVGGVSGTRLVVTHTGIGGAVACAAFATVGADAGTWRRALEARVRGARSLTRIVPPPMPSLRRRSRHRLARSIA